jgi:hypothetical protein
VNFMRTEPAPFNAQHRINNNSAGVAGHNGRLATTIGRICGWGSVFARPLAALC